MNKFGILAAVIAALAGGYYLVSVSQDAERDLVTNAGVTSSSDVNLNGKKLYEDNCASCHGVTAGGSENGPPFLHQVYVPGHHSDAAFLRAAKSGVRAHHWKFGDMPPVTAVNDAEIVAITAYIRQLQRTVGIK